MTVDLAAAQAFLDTHARILDRHRYALLQGHGDPDRVLAALADQGVTIIVTTHFMQEAEYCDRVAIMDSGQVLSQGSPAEVRERARTAARPEPSMEDAFIAVVEQARASQAAAGIAPPAAA